MALETLKYIRRASSVIQCTIERTSRQCIKDSMSVLQNTFNIDEPLMKCVGIGECKSHLLLDNLWRESLQQNLSFHATCGQLGSHFVGVAINKRNYCTDADELSELANQTQETEMKRILQIWSRISQELDLHKKYSEDCIFEINALAVVREARSMKIGARLLKNSIALARSEHFTLVRVDCTNIHTAMIAKKLGMQLEKEIPFHQLHPDCIAAPPNNVNQTFIQRL